MNVTSERPAKIYISMISVMGWAIILYQFQHLVGWREPWIYVLLLVFLGICEYFPMPVWKGSTSISFPLVYVIYFVYGLPIAIFSYGVAVLVVNLLKRRPFRIVCFNPAQVVISFSLATILSIELLQHILVFNHALTVSIAELVLMAILFYIFNNLFVDLVLLLRPQPYRLHVWKLKILSQLNNPAISIIYGTLFLILGNQNRGDIDVFSFFFFFSPLVGLALLSSSIVRLKAERNRLKALFSLTSMLNKMLPTKEWIDVLRVSFHELIDVDGMVIWTLENNKWEVSYYEGRVFGEQDLCESEMVWFEQLRKPYIVGNKAKEYIPAELFFNQALKSFIFAPLVIDNTTIGVLAVARVRTRSFSQEEVQAISTLANQLAIIIKTKTLIVEKEKRTLLEERNRIARDIHDGVAQTLAGALMKLETAQRKWNKSPEETLFLISDSMDKLRESLKQIRQSIYALRPYPTERVGMQLAMEKKMKELEQETSVTFAFEERGNKSPLSPMVEKILFDIFSESVQNILKHAEATKVEILLSYQKEHILFKIKDNGIGFSLVEAMLKARKEPHFGILQMNDAVEKISASLQIDSKPGAGTEISVCVPRMGIEGGAESNETYVSG